MTKIKGQDEAMQGGYTMPLPILFVQDRRISVGAKVLMAYLSRYLNMRDRKVYPSQAALAEELNVSKRTVSRWMAELKDAGYVEIENDGATAGSSNTYGLSWSPCLAPKTHDVQCIGAIQQTAGDAKNGVAIHVTKDRNGVGGCATNGVGGYARNGAQETKSTERKSREQQQHAGGVVVASDDDQEPDRTVQCIRAIQDAQSGFQDAQCIGAIQDALPQNTDIASSPAGTDIPLEDDVKDEAPNCLFDETIESVHIPRNLETHYSGIRAALKQSVPDLFVPSNRMAIQGAFGDVSEMLDEGLIDNRGPVGMLVHKVKAHCATPSRDFQLDEFRFAYERSQEPLTEEELRHFNWLAGYCKDTFRRVLKHGPSLELVIERLHNQIGDLGMWLVLAGHGREVQDPFLAEAGLEWTFTSAETKAVYLAEYPDVDFSPLEDERRMLLRRYGIEPEDSSNDETT